MKFLGRDSYDWAGMAVLIALILIFMGSCQIAHADPDYNQLADAIRIAEGNSNYGVLAHYHHTSYRQACINTCTHAWKDYKHALGGLKPTKKGYLGFLQRRYAPIGVKNDPNNLNKNWLKNVTANYGGDV